MAAFHFGILQDIPGTSSKGMLECASPQTNMSVTYWTYEPSGPITHTENTGGDAYANQTLTIPSGQDHVLVAGEGTAVGYGFVVRQTASGGTLRLGLGKAMEGKSFTYPVRKEVSRYVIVGNIGTASTSCRVVYIGNGTVEHDITITAKTTVKLALSQKTAAYSIITGDNCIVLGGVDDGADSTMLMPV